MRCLGSGQHVLIFKKRLHRTQLRLAARIGMNVCACLLLFKSDLHRTQLLHGLRLLRCVMALKIAACEILDFSTARFAAAN